MNLHNVAKVFSYFKSHLNYVDFILLTCQMNPATHHCVAAVRYATLFFLTPHYTYHTWAGPRSCPCRPHVPTATTKCCYEMKIFLKFLDPKANNKSSETQSHRTSSEGGRGRGGVAGQGLRCELLSKQPRSCLLPGGSAEQQSNRIALKYAWTWTSIKNAG